MKKQLTIEQAYKAMFYFLENEYKSTEIDEIGGLLGSLSWKIFSDSQPADPAVWKNWIDAVQQALNDKEIIIPPK